mmetsp:Transcript_123819/g.344609  ORF Transcript_123819/g.344609 Transcript_123819/m.344609 type:complete len:140 (-) Transcript_123819:132-551(-)
MVTLEHPTSPTEQPRRGAVDVLVRPSHPCPRCLQHQLFFNGDHPSSQFLSPAKQSNGSDVVVFIVLVLVSVVVGGHPREKCKQHHRFFASDQPYSQLAKPVMQSNFARGEHPKPAVVQQNDFLAVDQVVCHSLYPARQS